MHSITKKSISLRKLITAGDSDKSARLRFQCPSGKACARMGSQHEILTHLQKFHKTSVTQYYCALGDRINIKFSEKSVSAVVIQKKGVSEWFLVAKMKSTGAAVGSTTASKNGDIFWVWYWGDEASANLFDVKLECNRKRWRGKAVSLECSVGDVIKSTNFTIIDCSQSNFFIEIK